MAAWRLRLARQARRASLHRRDRTFHRASGGCRSSRIPVPAPSPLVANSTPAPQPCKVRQISARRLGRWPHRCFGGRCCNVSEKICTTITSVADSSVIFQTLTSIRYGHQRASVTLSPEMFSGSAFLLFGNSSSQDVTVGPSFRRKSRRHLTPAFAFLQMLPLRIPKGFPPRLQPQPRAQNPPG